MKRIFVDGADGFIGSKVYSKLRSRRDLELIELSDSSREAKLFAIQRADIIFLTLSESENRQTAELAQSSGAVLIDATASFSEEPGWVCGFADLDAHQEILIHDAAKICVPSVFGIGLIALIKPLVDARMIGLEETLSCFGVCGCSIGGEQMAEQYKEFNSEIFKAPRQFNLPQNHKALKEVVQATGLKHFPLFSPIVANYYSGVHLSISLALGHRPAVKAEDIKWVFTKRYPGPLIKYNRLVEYDSFMSAAAFMQKDSMEIAVTGNEQRVVLHARYDNLGMGSVSAAIECMNLVMGVNRAKSLDI